MNRELQPLGGLPFRYGSLTPPYSARVTLPISLARLPVGYCSAPRESLRVWNDLFEFKAGQRWMEQHLITPQDQHVNVMMRPADPAQMKIDRPSSCDPPRCLERMERRRNLEYVLEFAHVAAAAIRFGLGCA